MSTVAQAPRKHDVVGIPVTPGGVGSIQCLLDAAAKRGPVTVTFVNPAACMLARRHPHWTALLRQMDIVACDGSGMAAAARRAGLAQQRESFDATSLAGPVFQWAARKSVRVGLVGGRPGVASLASEYLQEAIPGLRMTKCFSGYGESVQEALRYHAESQTGLVVCGMGAPRQEQFLVDLVARGWTGIGFTCGGYFDQVRQGGEAYYPPWIDRLNLRFAYRLYREPRRLWRRYLLDYPVFIHRYLFATRGRSASAAPSDGGRP